MRGDFTLLAPINLRFWSVLAVVLPWTFFLAQRLCIRTCRGTISGATSRRRAARETPAPRRSRPARSGSPVRWRCAYVPPSLSRPATPHPFGIAQSGNRVTSLALQLYQAVDNCGGRFTIIANYAQGVLSRQGAERSFWDDEAPTLRELECEVIAHPLHFRRRGDGESCGGP